ncbi:EF-P lysine aminoacylase GenX [Formicincola oecophyllae]|uniref:EF-P lysine aminoacylase GenX n=1 Tax=Formicincola oecophyllae TaxID=2558361 RepID=A0A4Y6U6S0_9PROT|nr:EF-P lysine aminoacylase EpmA [Formicincola oecophyllae]QDH13062.1 EF-P lysine aminoacylase GenX [Formicincola oecophyllae]
MVQHHPSSTPPLPHALRALAEKAPFLKRRTMMAAGVRAFFTARGLLEVQTPALVPVPGEEVHLRCMAVQVEKPEGGVERHFLHTSPEFAMKRLLAALCGTAGIDREGPVQGLFQLARVWRNGEESATHSPEFTMLEWYRPYFTLPELMAETEGLLRALLPPRVKRGGHSIDLAGPFERLTVEDAFLRHVGCSVLATLRETAPGNWEGDVEALAQAAGTKRRGHADGWQESWEDLFFRLMMEHVEPHLGVARPTFLTDWPAPQAALARRRADNGRVALRFELYAGGLELANAFDELTDGVEQRQRFQRDRAQRLHLHPDQDWALDEAFLEAVPHMPPTCGIALGFDRLVMLATGAGRIQDVQF